jgi:probable O-glycosylation ligase (exosortase A-associated)
MLRSLWLVAVYLAFLGLGVVTPFVLTLGYVWVDTFQPQSVAYVILNELPVAMIMGVAAFASYLMVDRRAPPPLMALTVIQILMAIWMTATLLWAVAPERASIKWDWAFKTAAFSAFIPFVIRSRVQIEAFASTYVFSLAGNFVPFGLKVLISGGGYGQNLGLLGGNAGLSEGGYLSTVCLMAVPLTLYLGKHSQLIPRLPKISLAYLGVAALAVITALGTYERSALVGLAVLVLYMFARSRNKLLFGTIVVILGGVALALTANSWLARMETSSDYMNENSALVRLLVWKWTLDFSTTHPFGGGFDSYVTNTIIIPGNAANPLGGIEFGRAFHSIYFEVLGELGYPGIAMFLGAGAISVLSLIGLSRKCRKIPDLAWVADMSDAVTTGTLVFLTAGAFVGIAFQPPFWYFIAMSVSLQAFVYRYERIQGFSSGSWVQAQAVPEPAAPTQGQGWRRPGVAVARRDLARR